MKNFIIAISIFILATSYVQSQSKFIIGAVNINNYTSSPNNITQAQWDTIQDLELNWGEAAIWYSNSAAAALLSDAFTKNVSIGLSFTAWGNAVSARRWEYDPEWEKHFSFNMMVGDTSIETLGNIYPDANLIGRQANARWVLIGRDNPGYIANGLLLTTDQPDDATYYVKVRMKVALGTDITKRTPVADVIVQGGSPVVSKDSVIYANNFTATNVFQDIYILHFDKSSSGPAMPATNTSLPLRALPSLPLGAPMTVGTSQSQSDTTPYNYKVYWYDSVSCFLDCVYIDDQLADSTYRLGTHDSLIAAEVNYFKGNSGLSRYLVYDEAQFPDQLRGIEYVYNKIQSTLGTGSSVCRQSVLDRKCFLLRDTLSDWL